MTIEEVNTKLEVLAKNYAQTVRDLRAADEAYNLRFWDLMIRSGMGNQDKREAEANLVCQAEGLLEPFQILKAEVKVLLFERDCYVEIARNIRTSMNENRQGGGE